MTLKQEQDKFIGVTKLILKANISKKIETITSYKTKIILAYNVFTTYCINKFNATTDENNKDILRKNAEYAVSKLKECLLKLNCEHSDTISAFDLIDEDQIGTPSVSRASSSETEPSTDSGNVDNQTDEESDENPLIQVSTLFEQNPTMANLELLNLCKSILNTDYKGEPLELESFVNKVSMLDSLTEAAQKNLLFSFVKSKLASKALEAIKPTDATTAQLIASLRERIKPESSEVIQGKLTALRMAHRPIQDFAKQAEELADAFKRSLVVEGFPEAKAHEMTIKKTVEVCREAAQSDVVKSVLAASQFTTSQDVIAKFVTELDKSKAEKQVLAMRRFNSQGRGNNFRGRGGYHSQNRGFGQNRFDRQRNGFQNRQQEQYPAQANGNRNNYYRGNGSNQYGNRSNNTQRNPNRNNANAQNVRAFQNEANSGNGETALQIQMGAPTRH